jgi:secondary thiamine-phosphate synthase enzyme
VAFQKEIILPRFERGFHLITPLINENIKEIENNGILHIFLKHTSAGLTINENADPSVRVDFENYFNKIIPENQNYFTHISEGPDDMPSHIKTSIIGNSITIPITNGKMNLGIWQGIYFCEFRNHVSKRSIILTFIS